MQYLKSVSKATSVKEIGILKEATATDFGLADFKYRPVFSVFDIGTIVPPVPLDNTTINLMQAFNFELLRENGIESHFVGMVGDNGKILNTKEVIKSKRVPDVSRVKFVNRIMPEFKNGKWDYSVFAKPPVNNFVVPIEFISRNELSENSSVWRRIADGEITLTDLGLSADFKKGSSVPAKLKPILDYSTKFEPDDRYISANEAMKITGLDKDIFDHINETTRKASNLMTDYARSRSFIRDDGKVEYVVFTENGQKKCVLGDSVCTWHEDRLISSFGLGISKQLIRDQIKKLNKTWYEEIGRAKKKAKSEGYDDFRKLMDPNIKYVSPMPEFFEAVNNLFRAGTNQWVGDKVYNIHPNKNDSLIDSLGRAIEEFMELCR